MFEFVYALIKKNHVNSSLFLFSLVQLSVSFAQQPHDLIKDSVVFLEATGTVHTSTADITETVRATGFFVSDDGLILTNYHLLSSLIETIGKVTDKKINKVEFTASIGRKTAIKIPVAHVANASHIDLMLLKMPSNEPGILPVKLEQASKFGINHNIFTFGFPITADPFVTDGDKIRSTDGPSGYLWTTKILFSEGQSGSPIFTKDGLVIGVVKGNSKDNTRGHFIPIEMGASLLAPIELSKLRKEIANVKATLDEIIGHKQHSPKVLGGRVDTVETTLKQDYTWRATFTNSELLQLKYTKRLESTVVPKNVVATVFLLGVFDDKDKAVDEEIEEDIITHVFDDGKGGIFDDYEISKWIKGKERHYNKQIVTHTKKKERFMQAPWRIRIDLSYTLGDEAIIRENTLYILSSEFLK